MAIPELAITIAAIGFAVCSARACYRVVIGRRSWWFRAVVTVVGLGYGLGGASGLPARALLATAGVLAGATMLRDGLAWRDRLARRLAVRPGAARSYGAVVDVDPERHVYAAAAVETRPRCVRTRTPRMT